MPHFFLKLLFLFLFSLNCFVVFAGKSNIKLFWLDSLFVIAVNPICFPMDRTHHTKDITVQLT